jgi:hypothetical protein
LAFSNEHFAGIYKKRPYEIYKLLTAVIVEKVITVREDEKYILQHCLNILIRIVSRNKRRNVPTFRFSLPLNRFFIFTKIKQTGRDSIGPMIIDGIP